VISVENEGSKFSNLMSEHLGKLMQQQHHQQQHQQQFLHENIFICTLKVLQMLGPHTLFTKVFAKQIMETFARAYTTHTVETSLIKTNVFNLIFIGGVNMN
jgi:hypothetical protein